MIRYNLSKHVEIVDKHRFLIKPSNLKRYPTTVLHNQKYNPRPLT